MAENYKGEVLKKAREDKGIPLEMAHESLKIPMDALRAIEDGYSVRNLSPFYLRGFIKMYAKYLDVDIKEVIVDYKKEELPRYIKKEVNLPSFSMTEFLKKFFTRERQRQIFVILGILLFVFVCSSVMKSCARNKASKASSKRTAAPVDQEKAQMMERVKTVEAKNPVKIKEELKQKAVQEVPAQVPVVKNQERQKEVKDITLTIRTKKNNWLKVKVDGQTVFQSSLDKGAVETWKAKDNIEITAKYIHEVEFEINGKLIGPLSKKEVSNKSVIITKDGLQVVK